jgi:hypothetical protein
MQDQHFMQQWNTDHERFSNDVDRLARKIFEALGSGLRDGRHDDSVKASEQALDDREKRSAPQNCPLAHRARLTAIGIIAGVLAGSALAMITPLVTASNCPEQDNQICVRAALA